MNLILKRIYRSIKRKFINPSKFDHLKVSIKCNSEWYGNQYGGFYLNPDLIDKNTIVYSFGIGEDISFDKDIITRHNCIVYGFDPTPKSIDWCGAQELPENFHFYRYGISDRTGFVKFHLPINTDHVSGSTVQHKNVSYNSVIEVEMKSISDILKSLNHRKVGIIKMDIEGSEYIVIDSILKSGIPISQIVIELHERFFDDGKKKSVELISKLKTYGFEIFAISSTCEEISFVRKDTLS